MESMTIGAVAREAGVNRETLRYYERRQLLLPASRSDSGYRLYPKSAPRVVRFIKHAQGLGFSLEKIGELLSLRQGSNHSCSQVKAIAQVRLTDIEIKIKQLQAVRERLAELVDSCGAGGTAPDCPILDSLDR